MKILRAFKYKLKPTEQQASELCVFAGHRRFVWNYFQRLNQYRLDNQLPILWYNEAEAYLSSFLMPSEECKWLKEAPKAILQQVLRDLDRAYRDAFDKTQPLKRIPVAKKKGRADSFRLPQIFAKKDGVKSANLKVDDRRIWIPKIGWVGCYLSRPIEGEIRNLTITKEPTGWFASIQTECEVDTPTHPSTTFVGCDRGVVIPFAFSDGKKAKPLKAFKRSEDRLVALQRKAAQQIRFSNNWKKTQHKISKLHHKIACQRKDYLHKLSTQICKKHAMLYLEDLKVLNMTKQAAAKPNENGGFDPNGQSAKSGLNKSILDVGWGMFASFCEYKMHWSGGMVGYVIAKNTSRECPRCKTISAENRQTQARFHCVKCGYQGNADFVASVNISTRGQSGEFAEKSQASAPELIKFGRGLVCGIVGKVTHKEAENRGTPRGIPTLAA